ncbi:MAG: hypothetical protein GIW97_05930 [Candidatus Eremiobacteraeota bacterium]|nr:hypothetical protein [Candidatus Eremiobacteraeota bacterium]
MIYFAALMLGLSSGLRVMTGPAMLYLWRGGLAGYVLAIFAVGEYIADLLPQTPSRTALPSMVARAASGAFVGWALCSMHGASTVGGAVLGLIGALIGTYGGHAARLVAIKATGAVPAALLEDLVAIAVAFLAVTR